MFRTLRRFALSFLRISRSISLQFLLHTHQVVLSGKHDDGLLAVATAYKKPRR